MTSPRDDTKPASPRVPDRHPLRTFWIVATLFILILIVDLVFLLHLTKM